jgi:hypothetical protein
MNARIIAQDHNVIPYEVNGRKRFIIEEKPNLGINHRIVNLAIAITGSREWTTVYNFLDNRLGEFIEYGDNGQRIPDDMTNALESAINRLTY